MRFLRWFGIAFVVALAIVAVRIGQEFWDVSGVSVATATGAPCPADKPVYVTLRNDSARTVGRVELKVSGNEPGRSTNWLADGRAHSDVILQPGQGSEACLAFKVLPRAPAGLVYTATVAGVYFQ